jgi:hypothetical protein
MYDRAPLPRWSSGRLIDRRWIYQYDAWAEAIALT